MPRCSRGRALRRGRPENASAALARRVALALPQRRSISLRRATRGKSERSRVCYARYRWIIIIIWRMRHPVHWKQLYRRNYLDKPLESVSVLLLFRQICAINYWRRGVPLLTFVSRFLSDRYGSGRRVTDNERSTEEIRKYTVNKLSRMDLHKENTYIISLSSGASPK